MAAREVAVSALATVYSLDADEDEARLERSLGDRLKDNWPLPTALAFLAWFVFAPQCISTIAVTRRETNGWKRSEEHTSELQSLMRISYAVFCLKKKNDHIRTHIRQ